MASFSPSLLHSLPPSPRASAVTPASLVMLNGHITHQQEQRRERRQQEQRRERRQQEQQEHFHTVAYAGENANKGGEGGGGGMMQVGEEEGGASAAFHDTVGMAFSRMFDACTNVVQTAETHTMQALQHMNQQLASATREKKEVEGQLQALLRVLEENKRAVLVIYEGIGGGLEEVNERGREGDLE